MIEGGSTRLPVDAGLLQHVFDELGAAVYVVGPDGSVQAANPSAEELLGYPLDRLQGANAHALFHYLDQQGDPRSGDDCPILAVATTGTPASSDDDVFVRADGAILPVSWNAAPVLAAGDGPGGAVVVFRDRTADEGRDAARDAELALAVHERDEVTADLDEAAFLARVTRAITATLDQAEALGRLGRLLVPGFADWCLVDLVEGDRVRRAGTHHRDPARLLDLPSAGTPPVPGVGDASVLAEVLNGSPARLVQPVARNPAAPTELHQERLDLVERLGMDSAIVVGLRARRRVIGAITLVRAGSGRVFAGRDVDAVQHLADQVGVALDNIRLYSEQRSTAEALQHNLLPELPEIAGLDLCATYTPSSTSAEVGGDWFDVIPLGPGLTALVLGDLAGHDLEAAVHMSSVRTLLRAASMQTADPAEMLAAVDRAMARFVAGVTATAVVAVLDHGDADAPVLSWSSAGHPPLLLMSDGDARYLESEADVLLGVAPDLRRVTHVEPLSRGTTVVAFTDGLIERRDVGVEPGLTRLRSLAAHTGTGPDLCATLVAGMGSDWDDDVALVAATLRG